MVLRVFGKIFDKFLVNNDKGFSKFWVKFTKILSKAYQKWVKLRNNSFNCEETWTKIWEYEHWKKLY